MFRTRAACVALLAVSATTVVDDTPAEASGQAYCREGAGHVLQPRARSDRRLHELRRLEVDDPLHGGAAGAHGLHVGAVPTGPLTMGCRAGSRVCTTSSCACSRPQPQHRPMRRRSSRCRAGPRPPRWHDRHRRSASGAAALTGTRSRSRSARAGPRSAWAAGAVSADLRLRATPARAVAGGVAARRRHRPRRAV
jgi:hypothetical protein